MLDGAARLDELVAKAVADGQPAIGITDHGNMYGVLDFYQRMPEARHQAGDRHRGLHGPRPPQRAPGAARSPGRLGRRHRQRQQALLPPHPARRDRRGLPQPHPALVEGLPRGLLLQAAPRLGAARAVRLRSDRHHRLPRRPRAAEPAARRHRRCHRPRPPGSRTSSAATTSSSNCRTTAWPNSAAPTRSSSSSPATSAPRCSPPTTRTTPTATTTRPTTPCCACRRSRCSRIPSASSSTARSTTSSRPTRCVGCSASYPEACDNTLWIAERADVTIEFGKAPLPDFPIPDGFGGGRRVPAPTHVRRGAGAVGRASSPPTSCSDSTSSCRRSRRWATAPTS